MTGEPQEDIPGTLLLLDLDHTVLEGPRRGDVVLQPRPSTDPEDPLNWSSRRKLVCVSMAYLYVLAIGISTTVQYSVLNQIAKAQNVTLAQLNLATGLMFLFLGWGCLLWQPIAMTYGRRGVYIVSTILSIGPVVWTAYSRGAGQWYAHRILLGIVASPVESLPEVTVPDLFFAHERGNYMAFYAFVLFGSNFLAPFLAGFINDGAGWAWVINFAALVLAVTAVLLFFFMEETTYFRDTIEGEEAVDTTKNDDSKERKEAEMTSSVVVPRPKTKSLAQRLSLVTLHPCRPSPKQMMLKSWRSLKIIVLFPNILWAGLLYGTNLAWYSVINATMSMILNGSPYNFTPTMVGVAYLSPFLAALVSCFWAGRFADWVAIFLARRNNGIREAEHRLCALLLSALLATSGLILWGVGASQNLHFMGLIVGIGLVTFGVVCGGAISLAYAVDCFKEITGEAMVSIMIIRNSLGFAFNYAITPWVENLGLQDCFVSVAVISLVCTLSFLAMIVWGKSLRRASAGTYWKYVKAERASGLSVAH